MSFEDIPVSENKENVTDEEAVEILRTEIGGVDSENFRRFLDQGEAEAGLANSGLANLEWAFRLAVIYHKAGLNKEYELPDLEELLETASIQEKSLGADSDKKGDLTERIGGMIEKIKKENQGKI